MPYDHWVQRMCPSMQPFECLRVPAFGIHRYEVIEGARTARIQVSHDAAQAIRMTLPATNQPKRQRDRQGRLYDALSISI
jgi:hypothetical protein